MNLAKLGKYEVMAKRYTITSVDFEGEMTFAYNGEGVITGFFNDAQLNQEHLQYLHTNFPVVEVLLEKMAGKSKSLSIRLTTNEVTFDEFWNAYNHKMDKQRTLKAWNNLSVVDQIKAYESIPSYNYYLMRFPNIQRLYPESYLNGRKWENDYKSLAKATA